MSEKIAVIGSGTMGNGIAHVFAQHGHPVALIDVAPAALERALGTIRANLERQVKKGTLAAEAPAGILARISTGTSLDAVRGAELVVEAASENRDLKFELFAELDRLCRSGGDPRQQHVVDLDHRNRLPHPARPEQVIGMHFMNPVPVMQLVEVIRGHGHQRRHHHPGARPRHAPSARPRSRSTTIRGSSPTAC